MSVPMRTLSTNARCFWGNPCVDQKVLTAAAAFAVIPVA